MPRGIRVPIGFAVTADGYRHFLKTGNLVETIRPLLAGLDTRQTGRTIWSGHRCRGPLQRHGGQAVEFVDEPVDVPIRPSDLRLQHRLLVRRFGGGELRVEGEHVV